MTSQQDESAARDAVRRFLAGVCAVLPLLALVVVAAAMGPRLGPRLASHWSGAAAPDGFAATWGSFWTFAAITAVLTAVAIVCVALTHRRAWSRTWAAIAGVLSGTTATAWIVTAWATAAAAEPSEARLGGRMAILVLAVAGGAAVFLLLPPRPAPIGAAATAPRLPLAQEDRVSWTGVMSSGVLVAAGAVGGCVFLIALAAAIAMPSTATVIGAVVLLAATASVLLLAPVRLTVDQRGIRLASVLLRVPLIRVALDRIDTVVVDTIEPGQWGGWGYRVSGAGLAYVARRGPGIVVTRRGGNAVAITIDHPEQPAAVANALVAQRSRATG